MGPSPPPREISASPPNIAAVTEGEEAMKTRSKSRLYFLKSPASVATHGMDCESTRAEWMPMSLSAAEIDCDTASKRKMALVDAIAEPVRRRTLNPQLMVSRPTVV